MAKKALLYGVARNDYQNPVTYYEIFDGKRKRVWICQIYLAWRNMILRCYSKELHLIRPTYAGCSVLDEWLLFSNFRKWMDSKDWKGKHIDKDILLPGNKIYSPDFCVFISPELNMFLTDRGNDRGSYPIGASWDSQSKKFKSSCSNPFSGRLENLGRYETADEAHKAWVVRKNQHACVYADMQEDSRVSKALRSRYNPYLKGKI